MDAHLVYDAEAHGDDSDAIAALVAYEQDMFGDAGSHATDAPPAVFPGTSATYRHDIRLFVAPDPMAPRVEVAEPPRQQGAVPARLE